jgi:hypothetical protein
LYPEVSNAERWGKRDPEFGPIRLYLIVMREWGIDEETIHSLMESDEFEKKWRDLMYVVSLLNGMYEKNDMKVATEVRWKNAGNRTIKEMVESDDIATAKRVVWADANYPNGAN